MNYIALIAMAAIAAVAVWRVLSLSKSHAAVTAENTALKLDLEKARNADAVELATTRQALESLRAAKAETEEAYARRVDLLAAELQQRLESLTALREENARLATSLAHFEEERENREQQMTAQFKNLANDILRQNSADFKAQNEQRLEELLSPLRTNLDEFRKTVTDTYSSEARERFSLTERIRELVELNNTISREARELTLALRGNNQVQGDWGEMVLETILEKSGLQEGEEYFMQVTNDQHGSAPAQRGRPETKARRGGEISRRPLCDYRLEGVADCIYRVCQRRKRENPKRSLGPTSQVDARPHR